jgi:hypothetical protein
LTTLCYQDETWAEFSALEVAVFMLSTHVSIKQNGLTAFRLFPVRYLNEEVNCTEPSPHLVFPAATNSYKKTVYLPSILPKIGVIQGMGQLAKNGLTQEQAAHTGLPG